MDTLTTLISFAVTPSIRAIMIMTAVSFVVAAYLLVARSMRPNNRLARYQRYCASLS